jgi:hypothetical protein
VDKTGDDDPNKVNAQLAQGLLASFDRWSDWQCQQLEQRID